MYCMYLERALWNIESLNDSSLYLPFSVIQLVTKSLLTSQVALQAACTCRSYLSFCIMKWLEVHQVPSWWDANESIARLPTAGTHLCAPRQRLRDCENKPSFPRTQQNVHDQDSNLDCTPKMSTLTMKPLHLPCLIVDLPILLPKGPPALPSWQCTQAQYNLHAHCTL